MRRIIGIEYELDESGERTGRVRATQFRPTLRRHAVPPSQRESMPFGFKEANEAYACGFREGQERMRERAARDVRATHSRMNGRSEWAEAKEIIERQLGAEYERGREDERRAVLAWLRARFVAGVVDAYVLAAGIESGEHEREGGGGE